MKTKKNKLINLLKIGILCFGISVLLWNCETENEQSEIFTAEQSSFKVPSIKKSKANFESINNGNHLFLETSNFQKKSASNLEFSIDWESSSIKPFNEDIHILYTPIKTNTTNRMKTILASVNNAGEIETYSLTLFYDENSTKEQFSGLLFKYDIEGSFIEAYKYRNGIKLNAYVPKNDTSSKGLARKGGGCTCILSVADLIWAANSCGSCVENMLDCVCVTGGGGNGSFGTSNNGWSSLSNDLTNNNNFGDLGGGSSGAFGNPNNGGNDNSNKNGDELNLDGIDPWWAEDDQIFLDPSFENSFANCAYKLLTENNLLKDILKKLIPKDSKYDVTFKVEETTATGGTTRASYGPNGDIVVTINKDLVDTGNIVSISETILHEAVHAKLFEMVKFIGGLDKLNEFTNEDSEIGKLAACYNKYGKPELQHEFIWENYVKEIALRTETIHKLFPENYNRFHDYMNGTIGYTKDSFYESVAKAGLNNTSYFKNLDTIKQQTFFLMYDNLKVNGKKLSDYKNCK